MGLKIKKPKIKISTPKIGGWNPGQTLTNLSGMGPNGLGGIKKEAENWTNNVAGFMSFNQLRPFGNKGPQAPSAGEDPQVTALRNRLYGEAQDFEGNLGNYQKSASDQISREGDLALGQGVKGNKENFNRRGLLYSGLKEAGEQGVRGKVASTMAQQKAQSNKELTDMARSKWESAAKVGLQGYQDAVNREAEIAGINLQNQVARAQMMQALGQTGGQFAGSMYGSRNNSQQFRQGNLAADSNGGTWASSGMYGGTPAGGYNTYGYGRGDFNS